MIIAGDKEFIEVHDFTTSAKFSEFKAHKVRVKGMQFVEDQNILATGSNCDGCIKLWKFTNVRLAFHKRLF